MTEAAAAIGAEDHAAEGIVIKAVSKTYPTQRGVSQPALEEVSLAIGEGEFVALLGPSGCGKSTLLAMVAGLIPPTAGSVTIAGRTVTQPVVDLGMVFQKDLLFDWRDVLANVLVQFEMRGHPTGPHRSGALELLRSVGLEGMERRYPFELSGGMRQRVSICRALVHDPSLLLLDEPLGALDALTREQLQIDIQRIWSSRRKTALLVTHDIAEAVFLAQRVAVMTPRPGRIQEIVEIDLPFPRRLEVRESPAFHRHVSAIRHQFELLGVIHDGA